jgi:hypothetical protein
VKVFTEPEEAFLEACDDDSFEEKPAKWCNVLYCEWFSEENGRVFIESADFEVSIFVMRLGPHAWR